MYACGEMNFRNHNKIFSSSLHERCEATNIDVILFQLFAQFRRYGGAGGPCPTNGCLCPPQARRQSSVIGGGNIWGVQINFILIFGREDQKTSFYPGHLPAFGTQVSLGEPRRGTWWNLIERISLLVHKFRGEDQKKVFGSKS